MDAANPERELGNIELPGRTQLPMLHAAANNKLYVVLANNETWLVDLSTFKITQKTVVPGFPKRQDEPGKIVASSLGSNLLLFHIKDTGEWLRNKEDGNLLPQTEPPKKGYFTVPGAAAASLNNDLLFVGMSGPEKKGEGKIEEIWVYDTQSNRHIKTIQTPAHPFRLSVSKDGRYLYAVSPHQQKLVVYDISNNDNIFQQAVFENIGHSPMWVISD